RAKRSIRQALGNCSIYARWRGQLEAWVGHEISRLASDHCLNNRLSGRPPSARQGDPEEELEHRLRYNLGILRCAATPALSESSQENRSIASRAVGPKASEHSRCLSLAVTGVGERARFGSRPPL